MNLAGKEFRLLSSLATEEARRWGSTTVGPGDFLLAMLSPTFADSRASKALARCSITHALVDASIGARRGAGTSKRRGMTWNPACHDMVGFASGLAAGLGTGEVTAEDVLIAQLYQPFFDGDATSTRHAIFTALRDLGIHVPNPPWPERREARPQYTRVEVPLEDLGALISMLPRLVPGGITWNQDTKHGWVQPLEAVDLTTVIPFALESWKQGCLPCPCCGNVTLNRDEPLGKRRCPVCFWIDDAIQSNNPDHSAEPNGISLADARASFTRNGYAREAGRNQVRPPMIDETPPPLATSGSDSS